MTSRPLDAQPRSHPPAAPRTRPSTAPRGDDPGRRPRRPYRAARCLSRNASHTDGFASLGGRRSITTSWASRSVFGFQRLPHGLASRARASSSAARSSASSRSWRRNTAHPVQPVWSSGGTERHHAQPTSEHQDRRMRRARSGLLHRHLGTRAHRPTQPQPVPRCRHALATPGQVGEPLGRRLQRRHAPPRQPARLRQLVPRPRHPPSSVRRVCRTERRQHRTAVLHAAM